VQVPHTAVMWWMRHAWQVSTLVRAQSHGPEGPFVAAVAVVSRLRHCVQMHSSWLHVPEPYGGDGVLEHFCFVWGGPGAGGPGGAGGGGEHSASHAARLVVPLPWPPPRATMQRFVASSHTYSSRGSCSMTPDD
jgi:hypothetical protein